MEITPDARVFLFRRIAESLSSVPVFLGSQYTATFFPFYARFVFPSSERGEFFRNIDHIYIHRDYEAFAEFVPEKCWRVLDVGAYVGLYTVRAARFVKECGQVYSFEANPLIFSYLVRNASLNGLENVKTYNLAVSYKAGEEKLYIGKSMVNSSLLEDYVEYMSEARSIRRVHAVPLDLILDMLGFVDLLKIDVEGLEEKIVSNSEALEPHRVQRIVVEVHPPFTHSADISKLLEGRGYKVATYSPEGAYNQSFVYAFA